MKKETKCDKCKEVPATVYFTVVNGKFSSSKKRYCKKCAGEERIKTTPPVQENPLIGSALPESLLSMVQGEMAKGASAKAVPVLDKLNEAMKKAIEVEDYEKAAKIRDEISALQGKPDAKKGGKKPGAKASGTTSP